MSFVTRWRSEPFRPAVVLGVVIAWIGVGQWLLHALGVVADYHSIFHSMAQIQGFVACFVTGFLFTLLPRRTQTPVVAAWQLGAALLAPVATLVAAWFDAWIPSQAAWMILLATWTSVIATRVRWRPGHRAPPDAFVWLQGAMLLGWLGAFAGGYFGVSGAERWWIHNLSRTLTLQGVFLAIVLGAGSLAIPLMTRGVVPPDGALAPAGQARRAWHWLGVLAFAGSFALEQRVSLAAGMALRGAVVLGVLLASAQIHRRPTQRGVHRWLIWLGAWLLPAGYLFAAVFPERYKAGLHVSFIGGLSLLTLGVGCHVVLGHSGRQAEKDRWPWALVVTVLSLLGAIVPRALMDFDPERFFLWMGVAAAAFLLGSGTWAVYVLPKLRAAPPPLVVAKRASLALRIE